MDGSIIERHIPCTLGCSSSDGMSVYDNGNYLTYWCGSCRKSKNIQKEDMETETKTNSQETVKRKPLTKIEDWKNGTDKDIFNRGILSRTYNRYLVKFDGDKHIQYFPYFDSERNLVALKARTEDKDFFIDGSIRDALLFGQNLFNKGGEYVTLVEGENDAMAAYELLGSKYPVVSIKNGAGGALADCKQKEIYEYLDSFKNIVICFDNDEPGRDAATKIAALFSGKAKVVNLQHYKDANEYLKKGDHDKFKSDWWQAETYTPDGIVSGKALKERLNKPKRIADCLYPWEGLNELTYGIRKKELVTITAGSGLGKSATVREILYHIFKNTDDRIGCLFLEESVEETGLAIMSLEANIPFHLPDSIYTDEQYWKAYEATLGSDRFFFFDHFGSTSTDNIISKIRFMAKAMNCSYIVLDHVSIVVSAMATVGDERKNIDEIMTKLRMLVEETGIALIIVSHLKRPDGKGHEEGAATSTNQLRGSGSIGQLSNIIIGLERDSQNPDPKIRNTTRVRVLKNRFCGSTGPACLLLYDKKTGRMSEIEETEGEPL